MGTSSARRWAPSFTSSLVGFTLETLERDTSPIFAVSRSYELCYYNPAYQAFAEHNDVAAAVLARYPVGSNVLSGIEGDARERYAARFASVMRAQRPWFQEYTCSSPERYREYRQGIYPLKNGSGLVLINSLILEAPLASAADDSRPAFVERYRQESGLLSQCSNCRRTLRNDGSQRWDWVPAWAAVPPRETSHTICPVCFDYHWRL